MEASSTETRSSSALSLFIFVSIQEDVTIAFLHYFTQLGAALRPKAGPTLDLATSNGVTALCCHLCLPPDVMQEKPQMTSVMLSGQREGRFLHGFVGRLFSLPLFFNRFSIDTVALSLLHMSGGRPQQGVMTCQGKIMLCSVFTILSKFWAFFFFLSFRQKKQLRISRRTPNSLHICFCFVDKFILFLYLLFYLYTSLILLIFIQ